MLIYYNSPDFTHLSVIFCMHKISLKNNFNMELWVPGSIWTCQPHSGQILIIQNPGKTRLH